MGIVDFRDKYETFDSNDISGLKRRKIFFSLKDWCLLDSSTRIASLCGPRFCGKSTVLEQLRDKLGNDAIYVNCKMLENLKQRVDEFTNDLKNFIIEDYQIVLLLDEISLFGILDKIMTLDIKLRRLKNIKILITGSQMSYIDYTLGISFPCKTRKFQLDYISFYEYCVMTGVIPDYSFKPDYLHDRKFFEMYIDGTEDEKLGRSKRSVISKIDESLYAEYLQYSANLMPELSLGEFISKSLLETINSNIDFVYSRYEIEKGLNTPIDRAFLEKLLDVTTRTLMTIIFELHKEISESTGDRLVLGDLTKDMVSGIYKNHPEINKGRLVKILNQKASFLILSGPEMRSTLVSDALNILSDIGMIAFVRNRTSQSKIEKDMFSENIVVKYPIFYIAAMGNLLKEASFEYSELNSITLEDIIESGEIESIMECEIYGLYSILNCTNDLTRVKDENGKSFEIDYYDEETNEYVEITVANRHKNNFIYTDAGPMNSFTTSCDMYKDKDKQYYAFGRRDGREISRVPGMQIPFPLFIAELGAHINY
jgi:predicted AAA+ superfamily ATPase